MDPYVAFLAGIKGDLDARAAYNRWIRNDGYPVMVRVRKFTKTWLKGTRRIVITHIDSERVKGHDAYNEKTKVSVPFAALEVD